MWVDPPTHTRELLCADFISVLHLIKHRIHESDSNSEKKKNIFRIILEKGDMSEPLLEPRYPNMRKEGRRRGYDVFPLPFCETVCNSLLTNQFGRKLRWWAFGCHGNYSTVCSHLMHLYFPYRSTYNVSRGHNMLIPGSRGEKLDSLAWHMTNISLKLISFLRIIVVIFNLE